MANRMNNWRVAVDTETLSDHSLVEVELRQPAVTEANGCKERRQVTFPRWSLKNMNWDLLKAAIALKD